LKVAFVYPYPTPYCKEKPIYDSSQIQFGISYISSVLKSNEHLTQLFVLTPQNQHQIKTLLENFDPKLICFYSVSTTYRFVKNLSREYKQKHPSTFLLAGGCHVSLNPNEAITDAFDAICIGEGEYPTLELVSQLEQNSSPSKIQNLWIKNAAGIEKNATRPFLERLDTLPLPDRQMWKEWTRYPGKRPVILIARGCPFQCTYCCNHKLALLAEGEYTRFRSPQNIISEMAEYLKEYPQTSEIYFENETIAVDLKYAMDLCSSIENYSKNYRIPSFSINLRITPNMDFQSIFQAMQRANFKEVRMGLESGSEKVRREILNRNYANDKIIDAVKTAKSYGIKVGLYVMVGLPGETRADFQQTIDVLRKCQPDRILISIFYPYPGTELASLCEKKNLMNLRVNKDNVRERVQPILNSPGFTSKQVLRSYNLIDYYVFRGHENYYNILLRVFNRRVDSLFFLNRMLNPLRQMLISMSLKNRSVASFYYFLTLLVGNFRKNY
jgi:anaerobic magnesium-protoporphyrin IX monomethyl ester cyclase